MGSNRFRAEWAPVALLAVVLIVVTNLSWAAGLITAWLLGMLAGVALIYIRARRLGVPPSISLMFRQGRTLKSQQ